jgi:hypothetical protein
MKTFDITFPEREFDSATISTGTYNTKGYSSKEYKTKNGLKKGLISNGFRILFDGQTVSNSEQWNYAGIRYTLKFDFKIDNRGGKREGTGAKPKYNEPTKTTAFRIPISKNMK